MTKADEIYEELVDFLKEKGIFQSDIEEVMEAVRDYAEARIDE
jgi:DNA-directed RNA polymerase specialized sigma54-like protein